MLSVPDFVRKQIVIVFFAKGEKLSFMNDNLVVRDEDGKIKYQCTCYRIFAVYAVGIGSVTSGLIQRSKKFGFSIVLFTTTFRPYQTIGFSLAGNTLLHKQQYSYHGIELGRHIIENKIANQRYLLMSIRGKSVAQKEAVEKIDAITEHVRAAENLHELMGYEGSASRLFFSWYFDSFPWKRRAPRTKSDIPNTVLDIGYSLLFSFIEAILDCFGFDLYCGVMHTNFYMRKSLVCDIIEPFRCLIDAQIKKAFNLSQCKEEDFICQNGRFFLKWEKNAAYISWLINPLIERREDIYLYVQNYYRCFMRGKSSDQFPKYLLGGPYDTY